MDKKPLEQILNEKKRELELKQATKGSIPFDIQFRKEVRHFNTLHDKLMKITSEKTAEVSPEIAAEILALFKELKGYAARAGIITQKAVVTQISDAERIVAEKQEQDMRTLRYNVAKSEESLSETIARLYNNKKAEHNRDARQSIEQGIAAATAWNSQDSALVSRLHKLKEAYDSLSETRSRINKIQNAFEQFASEISDLKLSVHGQTDAVYLIAEEYAKQLDFKATDVNIILDQLGITCNYCAYESGNGYGYNMDRGKNAGLEGIFSSALINTHSISEVSVYVINNPFCFYRAKNLKIKIQENSAEHTLENTDNCEVELNWNQDGTEAGKNAKNSKWKIHTNSGMLLSEAEDCELEIGNAELTQKTFAPQSILTEAKRCSVIAENVKSEILTLAEDCEAKVKYVAETGMVGGSAKNLNAVVEVNHGKVCGGSQDCTLEVKHVYETSHIGSYSKNINAVVYLDIHPFPKADELECLNLFNNLEGGRVVINFKESIVRPFARFGQMCRDVEFDLDPTVPFSGSFENSSNCRIKMRRFERVDQLGTIRSSKITIDNLTCDLPETLVNCEFYINQSSTDLGLDGRVWCMQGGKYVNLKEEADKKKSEEEERITKFNFWNAVYRTILQENKNITAIINSIYNTKHAVEVVLKGRIWNTRKSYSIPFHELSISEKGSSIDVALDPAKTPQLASIKDKIIDWTIDTTVLESIKTKYKALKRYSEKRRAINIVSDSDARLLSAAYAPGQAEQYDTLVSNLEQKFTMAEKFPRARVPTINRTRIIAAKLRAEPDFNKHYAEFKEKGTQYIATLAS
ncbi:hypothetical protein KY310_04560 [Candidatus Woesearchaeota archaeon]|nr:hypothetical protein [Candidatus Woesearchaeota archaeon]